MGTIFEGIGPYWAKEHANKDCQKCYGSGTVKIGATQDDSIHSPCPECFPELTEGGRGRVATRFVFRPFS
jgi:DnaJ-class molecular chaperone